MSEHATAMEGVSYEQTGVVGMSYSDGATSVGVKGLGAAIGVQGSTEAGDGVQGRADQGAGVHGYAGAPGGTAVMATATGGAAALQVSGVARFSRSGAVVVPAGKTSVTVQDVALTSTTMVLATIQQSAAGNGVSSAVPHPATGSITLTLIKGAAAPTKLAWFVLN